jgi:NADPH:quinone reductase-like Zn-dependent oxidoreductase
MEASEPSDVDKGSPFPTPSAVVACPRRPDESERPHPLKPTKLTFDLILDSIGNRSLAECRRVMTPEGSLVIIGAPGGRWIAGLTRFAAALATSPFVSQKLRPFVARITRQDLVAIRELVEADQVTPVLDRTYALGDTPEALRHLEEGHARGKVVIRVAEA